MPADVTDPWCVIGAGPSGLTALKNLRAVGIAAECLEREDGLGGNWRFGSPSSRVFASTLLISSKRLTQFVDYPMPRHWPAYPDHHQCLAYLDGYARHFGLLDHVRFGTGVDRIERPTDGTPGWLVTTSAGATNRYAGVVIASGHNREPRWPDFPGRFTGSLLHAADYKSPSHPVPLAGKRVLVIGGGNSGCDIAVEVSRHAARTMHSTRRGYHVVPRFILGRPADVRGERLLSMRAPLWLRRLVSLRMIDRTIGLPWRHGLPRPDHQLFESHPVINDELFARIDAGALAPAVDVAAFAGDEVVFTDGSRAAFDVVICATGYRIEHPFIAPEHLAAHAGIPRLFLNLLHPTRDDIAVVGLIQPDSGQWGITDVQARLVARMARATRGAPRAAAWLYRQRQRPTDPAPIRYVDSPRHRLEVEHFSYRRRLERLVRGMDRRLAREFDEQAVTAAGRLAAAGCRTAARARG
ncbi:MAG: NAD(P)-binding domain-containing protein [Planctomycetia bacterium]